MDLKELEARMAEEPESTDEAIAELVASANVGELAHIAKSARLTSLAESAVEALGGAGGEEAIAALIEVAQSTNRRFVEGGSEQRIEQERMRRRAVKSLARARGVPPPAGGSQEEIAEFIEESRGS